MTTKLFIEAISKFLLGAVLVGVLIFLPAGTFSFFNGWLFMELLFIPMFFAGIVMIMKELDGYSEYKQKVKYRLIPFIW